MEDSQNTYRSILNNVKQLCSLPRDISDDIASISKRRSQKAVKDIWNNAVVEAYDILADIQQLLRLLEDGQIDKIREEYDFLSAFDWESERSPEILYRHTQKYGEAALISIGREMQAMHEKLVAD